MSIKNENGREKTSRFARRDSGLEHQLEQTEEMLTNTRVFLERLAEGERTTRRYIKGLQAALENDVRRIEREHRELEKDRER